MHRHDNTTPAETRIMCQFFFQSSLTVPRLLQGVTKTEIWSENLRGIALLHFFSYKSLTCGSIYSFLHQILNFYMGPEDAQNLQISGILVTGFAPKGQKSLQNLEFGGFGWVRNSQIWAERRQILHFARCRGSLAPTPCHI